MTDPHTRLLARVDELGRHLVGCVSCTTCEASALTRAVRAVLEEHEPCHYLQVPLATPICETCSGNDGLHDVAWPCPPVRTVARELRVNVTVGFGEALGVKA